MANPTNREEFLGLVRKSGVVDEKRLDAYLERQRTAGPLPDEVGKLAGVLVRDGLLTHFQAEQFLLGKWRRFNIGKYKVLERLGSGGMGSVYLCEHKFMRRRVAVKVLPTSKAQESSALERFYREARAVAALDHPNIVRAYDIDQDEQLHFLVMEYIDGANLQEIVKRSGPLEVHRAAHYIRQAAQGLMHAHQTANLIHRDIKPGNILVDRNGLVKVLDMGLARFFNDDESCITAKYEENVLGTADYLAPEQALDSHNVDIRADIYSLGATFYFCLTGSTPFGEGTVAQKLIWHQTRQPKSVRAVRPDVPEELAAVLERMMAKDPAQRYASPAEVAMALEPWTRETIPPPPDQEMPRLSLAAQGVNTVDDGKPGSSASSGQPAMPGATRKWEATPASPQPQPAVATPVPTPARGGTPVQPASTKPAKPARTALSKNGRAAAPAPAGRPAPLVVPGSSPSWDRVAPDTDNPLAQLDTVSQPAPGRSSLARKRKTAPRSVGERWRLLHPRLKISIVVGVAMVVMLPVVWVLASRPTRPPEGKETREQPRQAATLLVTKTDQPNAFKTVREALTQASAGDRIVVQMDQLEEPLLLDGKRAKDVTIEAASPNGAVRWLCPTTVNDGYFVRIANHSGLRLKGFIFDGRHRARDLVVLEGACPGLILEDLQLQGFNRYAVAASNCVGKSEQEPVLLRNLRLMAGNDPNKVPESALVLQANPKASPGLNRYLRIEGCRLEGPYKRAAIQVTGETLGVEMSHNRIFHCVDGLQVLKGSQPYALRLTLDSNTFYQVQKVALHFETPPSTSGEKSTVIVKNNLFAKTGCLAQVDGNNPKDAVGAVVQPSLNVRDEGSKEGNLRLTPDVVTGAVDLPVDGNEDLKFLHYRSDHPVAQLRTNKKYVGVPPVE